MTLSVKPLTPSIGAVIEGINLNEPLPANQQHELQAALLTHQVIFFRKQALTPASQKALAAQFGNLHIHPIFPHIDSIPEIIVLDNRQSDLRDNAIWHTDVTFKQSPPLGCILSAKQVPAVGGDTLWASSHAAYERLSPALQQFLANLTATHDFIKSFPLAHFGQGAAAYQQWETAKRNNPPVSHPVIRTHPITGKKLLYVNEGFTTRINELSEAESDAILALLFKHINRPEFIVRWQWQADDVAFWDNRATQHYATNDYGTAHRIMHRATILEDNATPAA